MAFKETFTVFLYQIEVLDWKRCRNAKKNLSQTTKGYNKRNRTWERNITRFEFLHVARYNLGQKLLKPITKYLFFALVLTKKLTVAKWKTVPPFPYSNLFVVTPELHTWAFRPNQLWTGGGERATLFPLEMIVVWREITWKYLKSFVRGCRMRGRHSKIVGSWKIWCARKPRAHA